MSNLGLYIREALEDKDEIYLLGIGTFKNERTPAYYNELDQKFMPPTRAVILMPEQVSDSDLISYLLERKDIDLNAAHAIVSEILKEIEGKDEVFLENLGVLSNHNGVFDFEYTPADGVNKFNPFEPILEAEVLKPIVKIAESVPEPSLTEDANIENVETETTSNRWLWPVIGTAVCVVIAAIWFLNPMATGGVNNQSTFEAEQETTRTPIIEPLVQDTSPNLVASEPDLEEKSELPEVENVSTLVREPQGKFELIIAAFKTMQEAEEYVTLTNSKGYQVYILKNNRASNLNKISYSSFQNEKDAEAALAKVRKELNAEAWLWENKRSNINN